MQVKKILYGICVFVSCLMSGLGFYRLAVYIGCTQYEAGVFFLIAVPGAFFIVDGMFESLSKKSSHPQQTASKPQDSNQNKAGDTN